MSIEILYRHTDVDDPNDVVGVHGMSGLLGSCLVGVLADPGECAIQDEGPSWCANPGTVTRSWRQLWIQTWCSVVAGLYCFAVTFLIVHVMYSYFPMLQAYEQQDCTRDELAHG